MKFPVALRLWLERGDFEKGSARIFLVTAEKSECFLFSKKFMVSWYSALAGLYAPNKIQP